MPKVYILQENQINLKSRDFFIKNIYHYKMVLFNK